MIDCVALTTFDSLIARHSNMSEKLITIGQAVQKMNSNRPTIRALQKAGRLAEKQKALVGHEDDEEVEVSIGLVSRCGRRSRMTKKAMNAESTL